MSVLILVLRLVLSLVVGVGTFILTTTKRRLVSKSEWGREYRDSNFVVVV